MLAETDDAEVVMARIQPVPREELPEFEDYFKEIEQLAGYLPNAFLTVAHQPALLRGLQALSAALRSLNSVDTGLKVLMSHLASSAVGCRFCEAHTSKTATTNGVAAAKITSIWEFETSDLFSDAERAALRLALAMGQSPNAVTDQHFSDLREYFDDAQIVEMIAAVCNFGFWNRWNDTVATDLEQPVYELANALLSPRGWTAAKHLPHSTEPSAVHSG
ncbi:MAG: carboxymuconolactone decarboxylase family protein [Acidimicrobiales bacterium]